MGTPSTAARFQSRQPSVEAGQLRLVLLRHRHAALDSSERSVANGAAVRNTVHEGVIEVDLNGFLLAESKRNRSQYVGVVRLEALDGAAGGDRSGI